MGNENYENTTPSVDVWDMDDHDGNSLKHYDISSHNLVNIVKGIYDSTIGNFMASIERTNALKNGINPYHLGTGEFSGPPQSPQVGGRKNKKKRTKRKKHRKAKSTVKRI